MSKAMNLLTAAALAAGTWAFFGYDSSVLAADPGAQQQVGGQRAAANLPQGVTRADRADEAGIRRTLSGIVDSILSQDGDLASLDRYLTRNDARRLTDLDQNTHHRALMQSIDQLRKDFKAKYNQDVTAEGNATPFSNLTIVQGEVSNPALLSNWPVEATGQGDVDRANINHADHNQDQNTPDRRPTVGGPGDPPTGNIGGNAANQQGAVGHINANANTSTRFERGMNVAIVSFPAGHNAPETNVSLVRETNATINGGPQGNAGVGAQGTVGAGAQGNANQANGNQNQYDKRPTVGGPGSPPVGNVGGNANGGDVHVQAGGQGEHAGATAGLQGNGAGGVAMSDWRVDLPNTVTTDRLEQNLAQHLNEVDQMKSQWPADRDEAYRMISHHIFMALYDVNSQQNNQK